MDKLFIYKIEVVGGKFNGYERYYDTYCKAKAQAKRYVKNGNTKIIGDNVYVDIYQMSKTNYNKKLIETIVNEQ